MTMQPSRDTDAARRRAERIRIKARSITEQYSDLRALVDEAERCEDHLTLGYPSWTAYVADLFGDEPLRLPRDSRIPMSNMLAEKGMSTRAIGSMLGVHHDTVATDLRAGVGNPTPAEPQRIDQVTGEVVESGTYPQARRAPWPERHADPAPKVVGLDGKTYTREKPSETAARVAATTPEKRDHRRPLADAFWEATYDLNKKAESLLRLTEDDRLPRNRDAIAAKNLTTLQQTASTLARVLAAIQTNSQEV